MRTQSVRWFLIPALALVLAGCGKQENDTTAAPPVGAPPGTASAPPGPGAAGPSGAAATPPGHPTPPAPGSTGNEIMIRKVKNALITDKVNTAKVGVSVNGGAITLSGSVPTAQQKTAAVAAAKQVPEVTSVKDQLTVSGAN
jgi:hyperosmotically inducible protein